MSREILHDEKIYRTIAEQYGTPCYVYDADLLRANYQEFSKSFAGLDATICFAVKANGNLAVLNELAQLGAGADIVSAGELTRALKAKMSPIIFSGVGKNRAELELAIHHPDVQINVESYQEFQQIAEICQHQPPQIPCKIAVRVNPNVDAGTHDKISTGRKGDKFGVPFDEAMQIYQEAQKISTLQNHAVAVHIGSQLLSLEPYRLAFGKVQDFMGALQQQGITLEAVDIGGGLGIAYQGEAIPQIADYATLVQEFFADKKIYMEPGRRIVGNMGELLTNVISVKESQGQKFAILDAAMNDLLRPTLYQAWHDIVPIAHNQRGETAIYDIVGPICETGDVFGKAREMPILAAEDLLVIKDCGAYGAVMSSFYNARALAPEIMVKQGKIHLVREKIDIEKLLTFEKMIEE